MLQALKLICPSYDKILELNRESVKIRLRQEEAHQRRDRSESKSSSAVKEASKAAAPEAEPKPSKAPAEAAKPSPAAGQPASAKESSPAAPRPGLLPLSMLRRGPRAHLSQSAKPVVAAPAKEAAAAKPEPGRSGGPLMPAKPGSVPAAVVVKKPVDENIDMFSDAEPKVSVRGA